MWQKRTMYGVLCALLALVLAGCGGSSGGGGSSPKGPVTLAGYCDASQKFAMGNEICLWADSKRGEGYVLSTAFQWTLLEKPDGSDVSIPGGWGPGTLTFTPDKTGVYRVRVVGDAGNRLSDPVDLEMEVLPWSGGVPISTPDAIRVTHFELAGDGNGNAIAIWQQLEQDENFNEVMRLYTADFDANNGLWGPAHLLSDDTGNDGPYSPQAVLHQDGSAAAMWLCYDGYAPELCAAARDAGSWSGAEVIETYAENNRISSAKLLLTPTGERLVFLPTQDGLLGSGTLFQFSEGTPSWEEVGTPSPSPYYSAIMQVEGEDRLVRVDRRASYYDPDDQAWVEFGDPIIEDDVTPWSRLIEGDGAGNAMYVWVQRVSEEDEGSQYHYHFYSSYYDGEEWSDPVAIAQDARWTGRSFLTFEGDGEVVFWRFIEEDPRKLWRSHYSDGEWSEAVEEEAPLTPLHIVSRSDENWMVIGSSGSQTIMGPVNRTGV
ncbi:hypothetical protein Selin_2148 [Desulfurispirillum indicum S5]|uniref:Exo-alpha-sialidase n=1 Tax=Desulfurispirillum indicum (strain ATCC BAA-1389 / DSM 22839 / S5) TaxID=653733 RepID=E6W3B4_DESIS|nr:hypothetical protein [Desulfurispirillum indicum]ADU66868.1 hypothetical protein Selin_2148 [Desulfurispirillum indicum S5]